MVSLLMALASASIHSMSWDPVGRIETTFRGTRQTANHHNRITTVCLVSLVSFNEI